MPKQQASQARTRAAANSDATLSRSTVEPKAAPAASDTPRVWGNLRRAQWLIPVALALLSSAATLWNGFATDDEQQILNNLFIRDPRNLPRAFVSSVWSFVSTDVTAAVQSYFRPLFSALFTLNYAVFGISAWKWHLVSILIHAAVTGLVYLVCRELTGNQKIALITASLFAVHPAHAESVAWISGVTDPLMSLNFLLAFYFYLRYRSRRRWPYVALAVVFTLGALWSKETGFALPLIIAYCELFYFRETAPLTQRLRRAAIALGLAAIPVFIYLMTRRLALDTWSLRYDLSTPLSAALLTIPLAAAKYLWLTLVPVGYSYQHLTPFVTSAAQPAFWASLALLLALACLIIFKGSRLVKFGAFWFLALLLPALVSIQNFDPQYLVQERYLYLSLLGFCLLTALGINALTPRLPGTTPAVSAIAIIALIVMVWGAAYIRQGWFWRDSAAVFERCVAVDPESAPAQVALASTYFSMGRSAESERLAQKALELDPQCLDAYSYLSFFSKQAGKLDQAIAYLEDATTRVPVTPLTSAKLATVHLNLGLLYAQKKNFEVGEEHIKHSLSLWDRAVGNYYTGLFYFNQERYEEALPYYEKALFMLPSNYAQIRLSIAVVYEHLGQMDKARANYAKYLELAPPMAPDREKVKAMIQQIEKTK